LSDEMKRIVLWLGVFLYAGIIWKMSSEVLVEGGISSFQISSTILHIIEFGGFGIITFSAILSLVSFSTSIYFTVAIGSLYGIIDEIHQLFVPGRVFSGYDMAADVIGVVLAILVWKVLEKVAGTHKGGNKNPRRATPYRSPLRTPLSTTPPA